MAISSNLLQRLRNSIKESTSTSGQAGQVVVNPDGSNVGSSSNIAQLGGVNVLLDGATYTPGANYLVPGGIEIDDPTALVTETEGRIGNMKGDLSGRLITTLGTTIAGEDLTKDVLKTEQRFSNGRATADALIATGAGFVHCVNISGTTATPTAGLLTIYDNTAESGTILHTEWVFATVVGHTITLNRTFGTGLYIGYDGTLANASCDVSYRQ